MRASPAHVSGRRSALWSSALVSGLLLCGDGRAHAESLDVWSRSDAGTAHNLSGVAYGPAGYVCVGRSGTVLLSTNRADWQPVYAGVTNDLFGVVFAEDRYFAVGSAGLILKSTNATAWSAISAPTTNQLNSIMRGGGLFVCVGNNGTLLTSLDGETWTLRNSGTVGTLAGCAWGNGMYLVVGRSSSTPGVVLTSSNGVNWVNRSALNLGIGFYAVTFGNGVFVAMDARGIASTTPDGIQWSSRRTTDGDYIFGIAFAHGTFVGAGGPFSGGSHRIITSPDGLGWQTRPVALTNSATLRGVGYGNGYFVAVGDNGLILHSGLMLSMRALGFTNGVPVLAIEGEKGRVYTIQGRAEITTGDWTDLFSVTNLSETQVFTDPFAVGEPVRFYRARLP